MTIELDGSDLLISPVDRLTEWQCTYLRNHKAAIIEALQNLPANDHQADAATASAAPAELIHWRDLTAEQLGYLWQRVKMGEPVQIYSNTLSELVWWVRDEETASALKRQGVTEICYTAAELREMAGQPAAFLKDVHQFKRQFGATLVSASAQPEPADTTPGSDTANPSAGQVTCGDCQHFEPDTG